MAWELIEEVKPEGWIDYGLRTTARTAARAGESFLGLPGDVAQTATGLANFGARTLAKQGIPAAVQKNIEIPERIVPDLPIPTSQSLRENVTKPLTGDYLEPKTQGEENWDQIISDAATLLFPFGGAIGTAKDIAKVGLKEGLKVAGKKGVENLGRLGTREGLKAAAKKGSKALGTSTAANFAKWGSEAVTGSPLVGEVAKIGTIALAGTAGGRQKLREIQRDKYAEALSKVPDTATRNFSKEGHAIQEMIDTLESAKIPQGDFVLDKLKDYKNNIQGSSQVATGLLDASGKPLMTTIPGGQAKVKDIINLKQAWNKWLQEGNLNKDAYNYLKRGVGVLNEGIQDYGHTNPEFLAAWNIGEELTGAMKSTNLVQKFLNSHPRLQATSKNPILKGLLGLGTYSLAHHITGPQIALAGAGATGLFGIREAARFYQLLNKSPYARRFYKDLVNASLNNNVMAATKALKGLDKAASQFDSDSIDKNYQWELID